MKEARVTDKQRAGSVEGTVSTEHSTSPLKPNTKKARVLRAMLDGWTGNRFKAARELHDHCIHSTVSELQQRHGLTIGHWPQSIGLASVGGLVATRSAGLALVAGNAHRSTAVTPPENNTSGGISCGSTTSTWLLFGLLIRMLMKVLLKGQQRKVDKALSVGLVDEVVHHERALLGQFRAHA